jgi:hypothetical protein
MLTGMMKPLHSVIIATGMCLALVFPAAANPDYWISEGWNNTDFEIHSVDYLDIRSGGPPKDGIPSIDHPEFRSVSEIDDLGVLEPVVTVEFDGTARAYPLRILIWHEIVNDEFGDLPITITYCPLCNSAIVFDRRVAGQVLDFGTTGKLRNSDLVMYDRQTESWWQQFLGEAIVGEMTGTRLETIPARVEAFSLFRARYPEGEVLVPNNPNFRPYGSNPYRGYDGRSGPYGPLFSGDLPDYIEPMARVVAFDLAGEPFAVAMELLRTNGTLEVDDVVLTWTEGQNSVLDSADITQGRDVGNIIVQRRSEGGLSDIVYDVTFAFVFHTFHPDSRIRQE